MPPEPPTRSDRERPAPRRTRQQTTPVQRGPSVAARVFEGRPLRIAMAMLAALTLVVTGFAWRSIDSLRASLATIGGLGLGGGEDGALDILLVGTDSRTDAHGNALSQRELDALRAGEEVANNTDTIILIRVPNDGSSATAVSIPRDAYVEVPGIGMSKINAAYGATKELERIRLVEDGESDATAEKDSSRAGREALIDTVANLTGVTVDHYAEVGLLGFVLLTDAVGGVDVCLNNAVDEPLSGARFAAGKQTLQGPDALSFVRQRHDLPRGDLDRIVRQQVFMASLVQKVLSAKTLSNPSKLSQLTAAVQRSVVLDDDWDILDLATQMQDLSGGAVQFSTIPVEDINAMTDYGESVVQVDPAAVRSFVASLSGVETTEATEVAATTAVAPDVDRSSVTVDVANAGDVAGLASTVSAALTDEGFTEGEVGNYGVVGSGDPVETSTVFAADPDSDEAKAVAAVLGGLDIVADRSLPKGQVTVVLAAGYDGPGSGASGSTTSTAASELTPAGGTATPAPPADPIDAGNGTRCVN